MGQIAVPLLGVYGLEERVGINDVVEFDEPDFFLADTER